MKQCVTITPRINSNQPKVAAILKALQVATSLQINRATIFIDSLRLLKYVNESNVTSTYGQYIKLILQFQYQSLANYSVQHIGIEDNTKAHALKSVALRGKTRPKSQYHFN